MLKLSTIVRAWSAVSSILATCAQMHYEDGRAFYRHNVFKFESMPNVEPRYAPVIRHMAIHWDPFRRFDGHVWFLKLLCVTDVL